MVLPISIRIVIKVSGSSAESGRKSRHIRPSDFSLQSIPSHRAPTNHTRQTPKTSRNQNGAPSISGKSPIVM